MVIFYYRRQMTDKGMRLTCPSLVLTRCFKISLPANCGGDRF